MKERDEKVWRVKERHWFVRYDDSLTGDKYKGFNTPHRSHALYNLREYRLRGRSAKLIRVTLWARKKL